MRTKLSAFILLLLCSTALCHADEPGNEFDCTDFLKSTEIMNDGPNRACIRYQSNVPFEIDTVRLKHDYIFDQIPILLYTTIFINALKSAFPDSTIVNIIKNSGVDKPNSDGTGAIIVRISLKENFIEIHTRSISLYVAALLIREIASTNRIPIFPSWGLYTPYNPITSYTIPVLSSNLPKWLSKHGYDFESLNMDMINELISEVRHYTTY